MTPRKPQWAVKLVDEEAVKASLGRWADKWVHPEVAHSLEAAIDALPAWKPDVEKAREAMFHELNQLGLTKSLYGTALIDLRAILRAAGVEGE